MKVIDVYNIIDEFAPYEIQAGFDNSGLNVGNPDDEVSRILLTVDVSLKVLEEAKSLGCNMIVSHHPIIFRPLKNIVENDYISKIVITAIKYGISLISAHTNVDKCEGGINDSLAVLLEGENAYKLPEVEDYATFFEVKERDIQDYANEVAIILNDNNVAVIGHGNVKKIAVVGGAGGEKDLIDYCIANDITLVTSELKHHLARMISDLDGKIITVGHFTSEKIFIKIINRLLNGRVEVLESKDNNPFVNRA